jgi:hypothetical protein
MDVGGFGCKTAWLRAVDREVRSSALENGLWGEGFIKAVLHIIN